MYDFSHFTFQISSIAFQSAHGYVIDSRILMMVGLDQEPTPRQPTIPLYPVSKHISVAYRNKNRLHYDAYKEKDLPKKQIMGAVRWQTADLDWRISVELKIYRWRLGSNFCLRITPWLHQ